MTQRVPELPQSTKIVAPDLGTINAAWLHYFAELNRKIKELEARVAALETP